MTQIFTANFDSSNAEQGDEISAEFEGFTLTARIYRDDVSDAPDERQDGFWPSLNPAEAGYIGAKSKRTLAREMAKARAIMAAWKNDEWFYCGIAVTVAKEGVRLTDEFASALWGIECNYPQSDNTYLATVANELASEAMREARATIAKLCAA